MGSEHEQIGRSGEHVNGYNSQRDREKVRNALVWNKSYLLCRMQTFQNLVFSVVLLFYAGRQPICPFQIKSMQNEATRQNIKYSMKV